MVTVIFRFASSSHSSFSNGEALQTSREEKGRKCH
jgi:hypothetical protein